MMGGGGGGGADNSSVAVRASPSSDIFHRERGKILNYVGLKYLQYNTNIYNNNGPGCRQPYTRSALAFALALALASSSSSSSSSSTSSSSPFPRAPGAPPRSHLLLIQLLL